MLRRRRGRRGNGVRGPCLLRAGGEGAAEGAEGLDTFEPRLLDAPGGGADGATRRLVLAVLFAGQGVLLSSFAVPVGASRVFPFQHAINAVAGVLLGPWWATGSALVTATLRFSLGTGSAFAFPGSPLGALAVGLAYRLLRRDEAALFEPVGTVHLGATLGAVLISPFLGAAGGGLIALMAAFALPSILGAAIGYVILKALRRSGQAG